MNETGNKVLTEEEIKKQNDQSIVQQVDDRILEYKTILEKCGYVVKPIAKQKKKVPLWFIVATAAYVIPITLLILLFPPFITLVNTYVVPNNPSIIPDFLQALWPYAIYFDVVLIIWAYMATRADYLIPWLQKRFDSVYSGKDE